MIIGGKNIIYLSRFHDINYRYVKMDLPSADANQIANNLSNLGQIYNGEDPSTDGLERGQVLGDGIRVHSMVLPELPSSTTIHFYSPGEVYSIKHDIIDVKCLMPGLLLAIRKVVHLKVATHSYQVLKSQQYVFYIISLQNLVYGFEKFI
ncbi:Dihydrodipicolinate reductase-like protein CRR1, chloroplastic [Glycine max]|nr:Dihydrodipicolinate reductase-like protein CRR1, chloroplastic [Glycine max]